MKRLSILTLVLVLSETKDVAKWIRLSRSSRAAVHGVSGKSTLVGTVHHRTGDDGLGDRHGQRGVEKVGSAATTIDIFGRERNNEDEDSGGGGGGEHGQAETVGPVVVAGDDDSHSIGAVFSLQTQIEAMSADKVSRWAAKKAEKMAEAEGRKGTGTAEAGSTKTKKTEVRKRKEAGDDAGEDAGVRCDMWDIDGQIIDTGATYGVGTQEWYLQHRVKEALVNGDEPPGVRISRAAAEAAVAVAEEKEADKKQHHAVSRQAPVQSAWEGKGGNTAQEGKGGKGGKEGKGESKAEGKAAESALQPTQPFDPTPSSATRTRILDITIDVDGKGGKHKVLRVHSDDTHQVNVCSGVSLRCARVVRSSRSGLFRRRTSLPW